MTVNWIPTIDHAAKEYVRGAVRTNTIKFVGWAKRKRAHHFALVRCVGGHGANAPLPTLRISVPGHPRLTMRFAGWAKRPRLR